VHSLDDEHFFIMGTLTAKTRSPDCARKAIIGVLVLRDRLRFHPEAFTDLDQIWEYIAERNLDAADPLIADIFDALSARSSRPRKSDLVAPI
jgi:hypothetical protein